MSATAVSPFLPLVLLPILVFTRTWALPGPEHGEWSLSNDKPTNIRQHPYLVSIHLNNKFTCTGAIVNWMWVVTVSSCLEGYGVRDVKVRVGSNEVESGGHLHGVTEMSPYDRDGFKSGPDTPVLLKLDSAIVLGPATLPVRIAADQVQPEQKLIFAGWSSDKKGTPGKMTQGTFKIANSSSCNSEKYEELCVQNEAGYIPCWGDFGGPLVNQWKALIGLFSSSDSCTSKISYFMNAFEFKNWIESTACCT